MKHLKTYEQNNEPQIGDYVFCIEIYKNNKDRKINKFLSKNVGQITNIFTTQSETGIHLNLKQNMYLIKYDNVTYEYRDEFGWYETDFKILRDSRGFYRNDILYYSTDKEKVKEYKEIYNSIEKYNL